MIAEITKRYGFDKPLHERYFTMLWNYMRLDFGDSLFRGASVMQLVAIACRFPSPWACGAR
ncbi:Inner membrane ABC transporter permease protein yejB [Serratia plymuthica]|uniref:Inner membrane ABC transporter permease protein yejB n=1 Tax=Serratia plymuthica TaxID=82996 RepID=A0A2X4UZ21_SERPL|nr:Inner membrane ABC transporter permease protein yejB [Serratia plymuthica]